MIYLKRALLIPLFVFCMAGTLVTLFLFPLSLVATGEVTGWFEWFFDRFVDPYLDRVDRARE